MGGDDSGLELLSSHQELSAQQMHVTAHRPPSARKNVQRGTQAGAQSQEFQTSCMGRASRP